MSAMVDGWRGDDWFHNGAFRLPMLELLRQPDDRARQWPVAGDRRLRRLRHVALRAGSTADYAKRFGLDQLNFTKKIFEHPAYDSFWQEQAVDRIARRAPAEGADHARGRALGPGGHLRPYAAYAATERMDKQNDMNHLVVGPWRHSGVNYDGSTLGPLKFNGDTAASSGATSCCRSSTSTCVTARRRPTPRRCCRTAPAPTSGSSWTSGRWRSKMQPIYLKAGFALGYDKPAAGGAQFDEYVSDPAKPVPFVPRPVRMHDAAVWKPWLVERPAFVLRPHRTC